jgi:hypothetical protein
MTGKGVYICYSDYGYDGKTEPKAVYKNEIDAKRWSKINDLGEYIFLEIQSKFTVEVDETTKGDKCI